ncbi:kinesin KIN-7K, chloroplastic, partial [Olea europaea subsp. europaea]
MATRHGSKSKRPSPRAAASNNSLSSSTTSSSRQFLEPSVDGLSSPASSSTKSKVHYLYSESLSLDAEKSKENVTVTVRFRPLSPREIRQGDEIAWYADGDTIARNEHNPSIAYAYGIFNKLLHYCYLMDLYSQNLEAACENQNRET